MTQPTDQAAVRAAINRQLAAHSRPQPVADPTDNRPPSHQTSTTTHIYVVVENSLGTAPVNTVVPSVTPVARSSIGAPPSQHPGLQPPFTQYPRIVLDPQEAVFPVSAARPSFVPAPVSSTFTSQPGASSSRPSFVPPPTGFQQRSVAPNQLAPVKSGHVGEDPSSSVPKPATETPSRYRR